MSSCQGPAFLVEKGHWHSTDLLPVAILLIAVTIEGMTFGPGGVHRACPMTAGCASLAESENMFDTEVLSQTFPEFRSVAESLLLGSTGPFYALLRWALSKDSATTFETRHLVKPGSLKESGYSIIFGQGIGWAERADKHGRSFENSRPKMPTSICALPSPPRMVSTPSNFISQTGSSAATPISTPGIRGNSPGRMRSPRPRPKRLRNDNPLSASSGVSSPGGVGRATQRTDHNRSRNHQLSELFAQAWERSAHNYYTETGDPRRIARSLDWTHQLALRAQQNQDSDTGEVSDRF